MRIEIKKSLIKRNKKNSKKYFIIRDKRSTLLDNKD